MTRRQTILIGAAALSGCSEREAAPVTPMRTRRAGRGGVLPVGATVAMRTVTRIEPDAAAQSFPAVLTGEMVDSEGEVVAGSGAPVRLVIEPRGLALSAVMIYGTWHAVMGGEGGAAPLGTLVRGLVSTPLPGGSVPDGNAIRTGGPELRIPEGSVLIFRLEEAAVIRAHDRQ